MSFPYFLVAEDRQIGFDLSAGGQFLFEFSAVELMGAVDDWFPLAFVSVFSPPGFLCFPHALHYCFSCGHPSLELLEVHCACFGAAHFLVVGGETVELLPELFGQFEAGALPFEELEFVLEVLFGRGFLVPLLAAEDAGFEVCHLFFKGLEE